MGEVHYMISEAAKRVNVETHVLRYWEEELALSIGRTEMGHRYYTEEDIQLFHCIKELKEQGMQLKELKGLIPDMLRTRNKLRLQKEAGAAVNPVTPAAVNPVPPAAGKTAELAVATPEVVSEIISDDKIEQVQALIGEVFQNAMLENNKLLQDSVSHAVSQTIVKEMDYLLQAQDRQEEERFKKLDHLIRQQQAMRKESAHPAPMKKLRKLFDM